TIAALDADWDRLRPELLLANVTVFDHDGRAALSLPAVEATLGWISVAIGSPRFYSLVFERPRLEIRRDERGRFYVAGIDLHAEQAGDTGIGRWVDYPFDIRSGHGGVRLWLNLRGKAASELTADVALSKVAGRVAKDTPLLELDYLRGRLGASQRDGKEFEVFGRKLTLRTATGIVVPPAGFRVHWAPSGGDMGADGIELALIA